MRRIVSIAFVAACGLPLNAQVTLSDLGRPSSINDPWIAAASWDLETFVGTGVSGATAGFYWYNGQFQQLQVPGAWWVVPRAISAGGDRFAGVASTQQELLGSYVWDRGGPRTTIGRASDPTPIALAPDGQTAYAEQEFWTSGSGWQALGATLHGRGFVTEDGRLVAQEWPTIGLWSPGTGFVPVVTVQSSGSVNIMNVSPNGTHLVGYRTTFFGDLARVWPVGGNAFDLGFGLSGGSRVTSASRDGRVLVGWQYMPIFGPDVFLWTQERGKVSMREYLAANGVDEAYDWRFSEEWDGVPSSPWISADGRTIIGVGRYRSDPMSIWMARIGDLTDTGPRTVSGRVEFRDLVPEAVLPGSVTLEFIDLTTRAVVRSTSVSLTADGRFTAVGPNDEGPFALSLKHARWLRRSVDIDTSNGNVSGVLLRLTNGDVDDDNEIAVGDYAMLSAAFGSTAGGPGWEPNADLNGDEEVTIADYAILSQNFGLVGDD